MRTASPIGLVLWVGVCLGAGGIGSLLTQPSIPTWYESLAKPSWTPPNWIFAPVWTALYIMMGTAAWLVWRQAGFAKARFQLALFGIQLLLNVAWSGVFFGLQRPGLAFLEIVVLWCAICATMMAFWRTNRVAGWLLLPYLAWVTYASSLNFAIWRMNA